MCRGETHYVVDTRRCGANKQFGEAFLFFWRYLRLYFICRHRTLLPYVVPYDRTEQPRQSCKSGELAIFAAIDQVAMQRQPACLFRMDQTSPSRVG